jgi:hypothetical protein
MQGPFRVVAKKEVHLVSIQNALPGGFIGAARAVAVLLAFVAPSSGDVRAAFQSQKFNCDFTSPGTENEFTIVVVSGAAINLDELVLNLSDTPGHPTLSFPPFPAPQHLFGPPFPANITVSGNGTQQVTVTFSGQTFPAGYWTHVGVGTLGNNDIHIAESHWSENGAPAGGMAGAVPGVKFLGASASWTVERVALYDATNNVIGHEWAEAQGSGPVITPTDVGLYYSTATLISPTQIPLDQLNNSLGGFGPESPIQFLPPASAPAPPTLVLACVGGLCLLGRRWRRPKA